jgi:hypothetical protein
MRAEREPPRLLLSIRSLGGVTLVTRDRSLELLARFREPESLAVTISKALDAGVDGVLANPSPVLATALAELKRRVPIYAVLPALSEYERHELVPGPEQVLDRGRPPLGLWAGTRLRLAALVRPALLFRGDWIARLPVVLEAEAAAIPRRSLKGVVLDAWLTDLVLAAGHRRFFEVWCRTVRRRFRAAAGFETHNLGLLVDRLREWDIRADLVVGPLNPRGIRMKPSVDEVLASLARATSPVIAKDLRAGGVVSLAEGARYARASRAFGWAPDLAEMEDVAAEIRELKRIGGAGESDPVVASPAATVA